MNVSSRVATMTRLKISRPNWSVPHQCAQDGGFNAAGLSFIGLGVRPPTAEWGIMVAEGAGFMVSGEWWIALFPGLALMVAVFCFNLLGDGLRDIVDPQRRT